MASFGNLQCSSGASVVKKTSTVKTRTYQDTQYSIAQNGRREDQPPRMDILMGFTCLLCQGTSLRPGQIKHLQCSHAFHQSCIDLWMNNNKFCPLCLTPCIKSTHQDHKNKKNRGRNAWHRMENTGNFICSLNSSAVPIYSAVLTGTHQSPQFANQQATINSRDNQLQGIHFPVGNPIDSIGNLYRSSGASAAKSAFPLLTGPSQGTQSAFVHDPSNRGEGSAVNRYTPMDVETPMDIDIPTQFTHFSDASAMQTGTNQNTQSAQVQERKTSIIHQVHSIHYLVENRIESTGRSTHSPGAPARWTAFPTAASTDPGTQYAIAQFPSTSGEDQTLCRHTPMDTDTFYFS